MKNKNYFSLFTKLKQGITPYGKAPHKPVLLLSVLQAFQNKLILSNYIQISPELILLYKSNWKALIETNHVCNFALPFWHLKGEHFWYLKPRLGFENFLIHKESVSSINQLNQIIDSAFLDDELFELMMDEKSNLMLQEVLLSKYFPTQTSDFKKVIIEAEDYITTIESKILNEPVISYKAEIAELLDQKNEEEIYLRGSLFKRKIPQVYQNTCCISGMRVDATINVSMIDACHIVPFSESYDDTITNGIALCPNLHRAFDRGLIGIDDHYKVVVSKKFIETNLSSYQIKIFEGKKINLPDSEKYFPLQENLRKHRRKFGI